MLRQNLDNSDRISSVLLPDHLANIIGSIANGYKKEKELVNCTDMEQDYFNDIVVDLIRKGLESKDKIFEINSRKFTAEDLYREDLNSIIKNIIVFFNNESFDSKILRMFYDAMEKTFSGEVHLDLKYFSNDIYDLLIDDSVREFLSEEVHKRYSVINFCSLLARNMEILLVEKVGNVSLLFMYDNYWYCKLIDGMDLIITKLRNCLQYSLMGEDITLMLEDLKAVMKSVPKNICEGA